MSSFDYPVRTPPAYWFVLAALILLGAIGLGLALLALSHGAASLSITGLGLLLAIVPPWYYLSTGEYRAAGRIRVGPDIIEVPDARGAPLQFAVSRLRLHLTRVEVRHTLFGVPIARTPRGTVLDLRDGLLRRRISTLTLLDPDQAEPLLADIERVRRGEPPLGPHELVLDPTKQVQRPRSALEEQLDRELAALD